MPKYLIRCLLICGFAFFLSGCSQNTGNNTSQSPIAQASDRQVKLGGFEFGSTSPTPTATATTPPSPTPTRPTSPTPTPTFTPTATPTVQPTPKQPSPTSTPSPSPSPTSVACQIHAPMTPGCVCGLLPVCRDNHPTYDPNTGSYTYGYCNATQPYCAPTNPQCTGNISCNQRFEAGLCTMYCWEKPVVYLYPAIPMWVSVLLEIPGRVTVSDPLYPENGWNVFALPGSKIVHNGKTYPYLYYETEVGKPNTPNTGIVIEKEKLAVMLTLFNKQIGLNDKEIADFLDYWMPSLSSYDEPYWLVQIIDHEEKQRTDKVVINPEPDTRIEVLYNFKPLKEPVSIAPMLLPHNPPKRVGFTMVEWGGGIEKK